MIGRLLDAISAVVGFWRGELRSLRAVLASDPFGIEWDDDALDYDSSNALENPSSIDPDDRDYDHVLYELDGARQEILRLRGERDRRIVVEDQTKDAAKAAACAERDRHGWKITDYQVGRLVEATVAVWTGSVAAEDPVVDCEGWDLDG